MDRRSLESAIDAAWEARESVSPATKGEVRDAVDAALDGLDAGKLRVAENADGKWVTQQWLKKAVLLSFRLQDSVPMEVAAGAYDKVALKFAGWGANRFREAGTMVDTWATIGSCAQIGKNCHISGGTGIGGVLEPLQAGPVIIEDNCFIGARSEVAEGVIVGEGSVISMGVFIGQSTKIVDRESGEIFYGRVPPYSVVVPGMLPHAPDRPGLACAVIVKRVDARTRAKTSINELLRD